MSAQGVQEALRTPMPDVDETPPVRSARIISLREEDLKRTSSQEAKPKTRVHEGYGWAGATGSIQAHVVEAQPEQEKARSVTVHAGIGMDLHGTGSGSAYDDERAARLKAELGDAPIVGLDDRPAYRLAKRTIDIVFSAGVLVAFSWLFAILALAVKIDDPKGPVFFGQERVGKDGRTFKMWKFRSMCVDAEAKLADLKEMNEKDGPVFKIADDPRITRVGKVIRKLSLDELPQFVNVLKGEMSVVGPRPALPAEVEVYTERQRKRLMVRPGITCYWQTRRNRDTITFDEWVDLDLLYIKKCSFWTDSKLIVQTIGVVLTAQGS